MAMLCAERVICSSSLSYGYSSNNKLAVAGTPSSMVSMVGRRNVLVGEKKLTVARRSSSFSCRSSVKPLSDSNGNVVEFESGMPIISLSAILLFLEKLWIRRWMVENPL